MKKTTDDIDLFSLLIESFVPPEQTTNELAASKLVSVELSKDANECAKVMKSKLMMYIEKHPEPLTRAELQTLFYERTESRNFSTTSETADRFLKAALALYEKAGDKERNEYIETLTTFKEWFEDHLDEPDSILIGLQANDKTFDIMSSYYQKHTFYEVLLDNYQTYKIRGRNTFTGYQAWKILRSGSIVLVKESRIFGRVASDVRLLR